MDLDRAHQLRQLIIEAEIQYFQPMRKEFNTANLPSTLEIEIGPEQFEDDKMIDIEVTDAAEVSNVLQEAQSKKIQKIVKFLCPVCQIAFLDKNNLRSHIKNAHKNTSGTKNEVSESKNDNVRHINYIYKCPICKKVLSYNQTLRNHIEAVHKKLKRFACDKCPTKCYYKAGLQTHLMSHIKNPNFKPKPHNTYDSSRPFKCDHKHCGKFFNSKNDLKGHKKLHLGKIVASK